MRNEFTAVVERQGRWHIAYCPEIPGANGQGKKKAAALKSLRDAIALMLEDRRKDGLRGVPDVLASKICRGLSVPEVGC
jgi:predicted RNase H-like HicB family nuclease